MLTICQLRLWSIMIMWWFVCRNHSELTIPNTGETWHITDITGQQIGESIGSNTHEQKGKTELHLPILIPLWLHTHARTQQVGPFNALLPLHPHLCAKNVHTKQREFMSSFRPVKFVWRILLQSFGKEESSQFAGLYSKLLRICYRAISSLLPEINCTSRLRLKKTYISKYLSFPYFNQYN